MTYDIAGDFRDKDLKPGAPLKIRASDGGPWAYLDFEVLIVAPDHMRIRRLSWIERTWRRLGRRSVTLAELGI